MNSAKWLLICKICKLRAAIPTTKLWWVAFRTSFFAFPGGCCSVKTLVAKTELLKSDTMSEVKHVACRFAPKTIEPRFTDRRRARDC